MEELRNICLFPTGGIQEYPTENSDEVYPGIYIGNEASAADINQLKKKSIGYVLNAAYGRDKTLNMVEPLAAKDYALAGIQFLGIPAVDCMSYPLDQHFNRAITFIRECLHSGNNVLVHCKQGISRSAALVLAYLVAEVGMTLQEATRAVRNRREIMPNDGFLVQLCNLNEVVNRKH
ncbi:dual specificity protein phosphatase 3 [Caerostris darwini]|uniref:protein-serine/threonine phosphatase n=1 Tax=Caerostris darwini TaxID=1538125 RepID=A0AAV4S5S2_9ARAC|nr:dual specificity protein phosphatase 3 [Caerostris darwini]